MSNHKQRLNTGAKPPALTGSEVAHFSMSQVARFSMSLDSGQATQLGFLKAEMLLDHTEQMFNFSA